MDLSKLSDDELRNLLKQKEIEISVYNAMQMALKIA